MGRAAALRIASATVLVVALIAIGQAVARAAGPLFGPDDGWPSLAADNLLGFLPPVVLLVLWMAWRERRCLAELGFRGPRRGARVLLGAATAIVLLIAVQMLSATVTGADDPSAGDTGAEPDLLSESILVTAPLAAAFLLATVVVQSSVEEILFRGYLMGAARTAIGAVPAVLFTAVVFGLCHSFNPDATVTYVAITMVLGVILGFFAVTDGSLWRSCAFHAAWNGLPALFTTGAATGEPGSAGNTLGSAVIVIALAVVAAVAGWRFRARRGVAPVGGVG